MRPQLKISPEVSGEIIELPVKEGQMVKKGDLLVRIKPDFYVANRNSAEASYNSSLASKTTARPTWPRPRPSSSATRNCSRAQADVRIRLRRVQDGPGHVAKAQLAPVRPTRSQMSKASLARAEEDLAKTTMVSPIDGTISRLNSQLGERVVGTAMMAGTEIMTIADLNEMEARVDIGEIDVVLIQIGQKARLEVDAFQDRKFNGMVTEIANSARTQGMSSPAGSHQVRGPHPRAGAKKASAPACP